MFAAAASGAAMAAAPHPDAALLELSRQLEAAQAEEAAACEALDRGRSETVDAAIIPASRIVDDILAVPARSLEGLKVKARAFLWCGWKAEDIDSELFGSTTDMQITISILRDLVAMGAAS
jgi:hypothetical protein